MFDFELKSVQYANDIWVALHPDTANINNSLKEMEEFYYFAGLEVNYNKTFAMKLGSCRNTDAKYYTIKNLCWTNEPIKILGIYFHPDEKLMEKMNFLKKLGEIKCLFNLWKLRNLTWLGKITIINTLALSKLMYQLAALPTPSSSFLKELKNLIMEFLCEGKPHRIKYEKIIQQYYHDGLKLIDIESKEKALKAKWPLYFGERELPWFYGFLTVQSHTIWTANIEAKHKTITE